MTDKDKTKPPGARRSVCRTPPGSRRRMAAPRTSRAGLVKRLWRAAAAQVAQAEAQFASFGSSGGEAPVRPEEAARLLASLARTLKELDALEQTTERKPADDDSPRDIEAFREDLARKLERLLAQKPDSGISGEPDGGGT